MLVYESLNPIELLDCSWFLHTSLWMVPWHLFRYGVRKGVPCLYRQIRRVTYRPAHPPIPRIVLIRVDGEAVPVNLVEDQASVNIGAWSSFEAANLEMNKGQDTASDSGELQDFVQSFISAGESCIATDSEARPVRTVSHQGEHQGGIAEAQDGMGLGSPASEFAEDSQLLVNQTPDEQLQISRVLVEPPNEPLPSGDIIILSIPGPHAIVSAPSDCDVDEPTGEFDQMVFPEAVVDDVRQAGSTDGLDEREASDQDPIAFSPWCVIDDYGPDESETMPETLRATSSFIGSQVTPTSAKNVRFAIGDGVGAADHWKVSLGASDTNENTCPWNLGSQLGNDDVAPVQTPVVPAGPSMDKQDTTSPERLIKPVLPKVLSEERFEGNDAVLAESPSLTGKPIVNLPSLVVRREDMRFVERDPMVPAALIEDIATRLPLQILSPIASVVVINMNCIIEVEEQSLTPLGTEELDQGLPHAGHVFGTLNDKGAACETLDIIFPQEDRSCPPSQSIEDSNSVCSPIVNCVPSLGGIRTLEIALSASATASDISMPVDTNNLAVIKTSPSAAIEVPGTNEIGVEVLYETPRYYSYGKDLARSLQNGHRGPEVSVPDAASTSINLPVVSGSPKEPDMEDQVSFVAAEKSNSMTIALTGQPVGPSGAFATGFPTTELSELISTLPVTCKEGSPLSMISTEKKIRELGHGKSREANTIPWGHRTISKLQERTLSGSMHAPAEPLPIPQTNSRFSRTSVLYETSPSMSRSVSFAGPKEVKGTITETPSKREQDLSASIHAPQRISKLEVQSSVSQSRDESNRDHRRSVTNPVVVSETKPLTKPCPPNWTAMPEVVDAFRMFKRAPSGNISSIAECTNRGPMFGVVGQKGIATNSLNSISATANIQNRWMHRSGLLLVRDLVSSDPIDFNLRPW
jgi:hypothetical protein